VKGETTKQASRVRFPLVAKLIGIISLIVLVSMVLVTGLATAFFAEDSRVRAEENNLTLSEVVAAQVESEVRLVYSGAFSLMDTLRECDGNPQLSQTVISNFFDRNPSVACIIVPDARNIENPKFLAAYEIDTAGLASFLSTRADEDRRARAGESVLVNASPALGIPSAALFVPYRDLGTENSMVVMFSTERIQSIVQSGSSSFITVVGSSGDLLAHPDPSLVKIGANFRTDPLVSACVSNPNDNMQLRYTDASGRECLGAFRKVTLGSFAVTTSIATDEVYAAALGVIRRNMFLTGIVLLLSVLAVWFFAKTVSRPVMRLVSAARKIEEGVYELDIAPTTHDELGLLTESFTAMGKGLAERERIKETFGKFVNRDIAEQALTGKLALGGVRKQATIFFSDIRSFTAISEKLAPEAVVEFLNDYMTRMVECIERTHGVVDKFIGDAIMGVWGAPVSSGSPADDAFNAIKAMLMMRTSLYEFNKDRGGPDRPIIRIGCGVNSGPCLAGQIGSANRMEYTVIGDAVNLASRIEALNKPFHTDILISEYTYDLVGKGLVVELMPVIKVKGKSDPLRIFAVVNIKGAPGPKTLADVRRIIGVSAPETIADPETEEVKYEILQK